MTEEEIKAIKDIFDFHKKQILSQFLSKPKMDVKMNKCYTCAHYQPRICYCEYYLRGKETAVYLCPDCKSKDEEMQEVANKDAFYGEALND